MKRAAFVVCASAVIAFLVAGCGEKGPPTIKVGVIAELTGDMPAVGESCKKAAELAVKEINDAGGLEVGDKKYKVKLFIEDNAGKADQSASAAQKLITQQKVVAIIGPNATRYAIPASEIAESSKVLLITPWSTNPKTTLDAQDERPEEVRLPRLLHRSLPGPRGGQVRHGEPEGEEGRGALRRGLRLQQGHRRVLQGDLRAERGARSSPSRPTPPTTRTSRPS